MNSLWLLILFVGVALAACSSSTPPIIGVREGKLTPCPDSPNCVSSQSTDEQHFVEPFAYRGSLQQTREAIITVIESMKRSSIVTSEERYIRAEFKSALFRFVDDVECLFDDTEERVHVRSASRVGYSDLGVNRKRIEEMRARYESLTIRKE